MRNWDTLSPPWSGALGPSPSHGAGQQAREHTGFLKKELGWGAPSVRMTAYSCTSHGSRLATDARELSRLANLQVCLGIFAGKNQVVGIRWMYAYDHLW